MAQHQKIEYGNLKTFSLKLWFTSEAIFTFQFFLMP